MKSLPDLLSYSVAVYKINIWHVIIPYSRHTPMCLLLMNLSFFDGALKNIIFVLPTFQLWMKPATAM